jgi:hypothetical protein
MRGIGVLPDAFNHFDKPLPIENRLRVQVSQRHLGIGKHALYDVLANEALDVGMPLVAANHFNRETMSATSPSRICIKFCPEHMSTLVMFRRAFDTVLLVIGMESGSTAARNWEALTRSTYQPV